MVLKAMGVKIDPEALGAWIAEAQVRLPEYVVRLDRVARTMESRQARMERNQLRMMAHFGIEPELEPAAIEQNRATIPGADAAPGEAQVAHS